MKSILLIFSFLIFSSPVFAGNDSHAIDFDDAPLTEKLSHPDWFKQSSGDLRDDLYDALAEGKNGLIIYFGQNRCAYCEQFIKNNMQASDIEHYIREHYDVIHIDIWSQHDIINTDGEEYTERELSINYKTNFTPSLVFYNRNGKAVFRLRGYQPPYKFRAALKYVTEDFYKKETFRDYLARAEKGMFFHEGGLNERDFFIEPPYDLKASLENNKQPLMVSFEQGNCHACDLLHSSPLNEPELLDELEKINSLQLNMWADTPLVKPDGQATTAKQWAAELGLFYAPTLIFFDPEGQEIIRIDSVVKFYRLLGVLKYINQRGYLTEKNFQSWQLKQREIK
ncbi:thioredoxin family protein [Pseudomonadota bacterium]